MMMSEAKTVRILTKREQKQSIKGVQKPKKNITKNYLESPFALEWPKLSHEDEEEVAALLRKSCLGLKKLECEPPWKQVAKYKGEERRAFKKKYYQKFLESLDPESMKKNKEREDALSHLVFGYNAVMKSMEKNSVAGILVNKNVKPDFVIKAFLPGCAKKCIPVVPLNDLETIVQDKETLGLPHTCMVLGLKLSVKEEANLFHPLYTKMCEAVNVEECEEENSENEEDCVEAPTADKEEDENPKPANTLSKVDISSYHLKRTGTKGRRAFIPDGHEQQVESNVNDDFLSFGPTQSSNVNDEFLKFDQSQSEKATHQVQTNTKNTEKASKKSENLKKSPAIDGNVDLSSMIVLDASGEHNPSPAEDFSLKQETNAGEKPADAKSKGKKKKKRKNMASESYVPAKTKQMKGNPNRKGSVV